MSIGVVEARRKWLDEFDRCRADNRKFRERIATLEAMVEEALRIFDLHLNTPETRALRAQWKELTNQDPDRKSEA